MALQKREKILAGVTGVLLVGLAAMYMLTDTGDSLYAWVGRERSCPGSGWCG